MEPNTLMDAGSGAGWLGILLIGGLAGWIAEKVTKSDMGVLMNIIVGLIGSVIGGLIASLLGLPLGEVFSGWFWGNLLIAVVGAVILLLIVKMFRSRSV